MLRKITINSLNSSSIIHRSLSAQVHVPRTRHLDLHELVAEGLNLELASAGIRLSEIALHTDGVYEKHKSTDARYFLPVLTHTSLQKEIFPNERIITTTSIIDIQHDRGQLTVNHQLKQPQGDIISTGYSILQKYSANQPVGFSDEESTAFRKQLKEKLPSDSYPTPKLTAPEKTLGKKILLGQNEVYVKKHQTEHNGVISANHLFQIAHMYAFEKSLIENTGCGFDNKTRKPQLLTADTFIYGALRAGDIYHVYLYTEKNTSAEKDKCTWVATITDTAERVIAIVRGTHMLTKTNNQLTAKIDDYSLPTGYQHLVVDQRVSIAADNDHVSLMPARLRHSCMLV